MQVLMVRDNVRQYIAKIYWALQKGLRSHCDLTSFGTNEDFDVKVKTYQEIRKMIGFEPDYIISDYKYNTGKYKYAGLRGMKGRKAFIFGDYWNCRNLKEGMALGDIDDVLVLFKDAFDKYPELKHKMLWVPPSVDIEIFKDWRLPKEYLVGFLGAGCHRYKNPYKDRYRITRRLADAYGKRFYTKAHPGWGYFNEETKLIGKGFSKAINKCKMFVTTAGDIGHCNPKYYEIAASGVLLICTEAAYMEDSGFKDGETCVVVTEENIIKRINYYVKHWDEAEEIISNAMELIRTKHTGEIRARELIECVS